MVGLNQQCQHLKNKYSKKMRPEQRKSGLWFKKSLEPFPIKVILFIAKDWGWTSKSLQFARWLKIKREEMDQGDVFKETHVHPTRQEHDTPTRRGKQDQPTALSSFPSKGQIYTWTSIAAELVFTPKTLLPEMAIIPLLLPDTEKRAGDWALRSLWIHSLLL